MNEDRLPQLEIWIKTVVDKWEWKKDFQWLINEVRKLRNTIQGSKCLKCGRDTIAGDCHGCEVDRLHTELEKARKEIDELRRAVVDLAMGVKGNSTCASFVLLERHKATIAKARENVK